MLNSLCDAPILTLHFFYALLAAPWCTTFLTSRRIHFCKKRNVDVIKKMLVVLVQLACWGNAVARRFYMSGPSATSLDCVKCADAKHVRQWSEWFWPRTRDHVIDRLTRAFPRTYGLRWSGPHVVVDYVICTYKWPHCKALSPYPVRTCSGNRLALHSIANHLPPPEGKQQKLAIRGKSKLSHLI